MSSRAPDQGVVFDLDGTLVDSEPYWIDGFSTGLSHILEDHGLGHHALEPAEMRRFTGGRVPDTISSILASLSVVIDDDVLATVVAQTIDYVTRQFIAHPAPIPGAIDTVRTLHDLGVPLGLASSSAPTFIAEVLRSLALEDAFRVTRSAISLPRGKPDPAVYEAVILEMKLDAGRSVAVEDSAVGVASALNAGMQCIWVEPHGDVPPGPAEGDLVPGERLEGLLREELDPHRVVWARGLDSDLVLRVLSDISARAVR